MISSPFDCKLSNKFSTLIYILGMLFFQVPFLCTAQHGNPSLNDFTGYYQSQQVKSLYIHIIVYGNKLKQIREWDGREALLEQKSGLQFVNEENQLKVSFSKDSIGKVKGVNIGEDNWIKDKSYVSENIEKLNADQAKSALDQKAEALVAAINSGSVNLVTKFVEENFSLPLRTSSATEFIKGAWETYRAMAEIKFYKSLYHNHHAYFSEYQYKSKYLDNIYEFSLKLDKDNKIKLYNGRITSPSSSSGKASNQADLIKSLEKTFKALTDKDIFSGAVLVAKGDKTLFTYASGEANKESHLKNTIDTRFNLGSMNKMFTALSIMQLVEKRKVNLTDPVSRYVDSTWLPKQIADQITIHHLLNHTSGLGDFFSQAYKDTPISQLTTLDAYKRFVKTDQLHFKPGTAWSYSNAGMILLGAVIEKVSGTSYFEYVNTYIYKPSGMAASSDSEFSPNRKNMALGYIPQMDGSYIHHLNSPFTRSSPAGGGYSTVHDLHKFAIALLSSKLISDSTKSTMFKDHFGKQYGYGFQLWSSSPTKVVGHSGGAPGVSAVAYMFPESGYIVTVLSNYDRGSYYPEEFILNEMISLIKP
jgi:CubicO group peptidase (beta-lactamase class C family)